MACAEISAAQREFFEKNIRPVLAEHCYECHNSLETAEGSLALDHRQGLLEGGDRGAAVVPSEPAESILLQAIRHEDPDLRMPAGGPKLEPSVIADFERWISLGAADPRDAPPTTAELEAALDWQTILQRRRDDWWCYQPIGASSPPPAKAGHSQHPVDRYLEPAIREAGLEPNLRADRHTLIRRASFVVTGLPPTAAQLEMFMQNDSPTAYKQLVDDLLESPHFGERWARHWMDWFRYADSHGSEGDPPIPYAWRYRDYLIRALNADVPYDQLVLEHLAGDLLESPRIDHDNGINESALGIGHLRFVLHGYSPTDALDELVRFTDNQIDVLSKAFLGQTVSCARCHDHKFDAISQTDFYALFGILASCRPGLVTVDAPAQQQLHGAALLDLKRQLRRRLASRWLSELETWSAQLLAAPQPRSDEEQKQSQENKQDVSAWQTAIDAAKTGGLADPLHAWTALRAAESDAWKATWQDLYARWQESHAALEQQRNRAWKLAWDLSNPEEYQTWFPYGVGLSDEPARAGAFTVQVDGERVVSNIYPAGAYSHLLSSKHNGVLNSPSFPVDCDKIWLRLLGSNRARTRFVMQNFARGSGPVYKNHQLNNDELDWVSFDMNYWKGDQAHLEIATANDLPIEASNQERSWIGAAEVICQFEGEPAPSDHAAEYVAPLYLEADTAPASAAELAERYVRALRACVQAWRDDTMSDEQAHFLGYFVRRGLLPNSLDQLPGLATLVDDYRRLEGEIRVPTRAPGVWESQGLDQPLFIRGNHKQPGEPVARRFLEALGGEPYETTASGRLQLAHDLVRANNPLTARVIVNRLWSYVFGQGLVATPDNFGRLGERPSHPELLDYLARQCIDSGWSLKQTLRLLLTSEAFQRSSRPVAGGEEIDPENRLLARMSVRRLEAEAIRDSLLATTGRLDLKQYGPPVGGHEPRRSVYLRVRRNSLDPLLKVFDAPPPITATGKRDVTNVPAQSLALLNDPFVIRLAAHWADSLLAEAPQTTPDERVAQMFAKALGRPAELAEIDAALAYLREIALRRQQRQQSFVRTGQECRQLAERRALLLQTARTRLLSQRSEPGQLFESLPQPIARWDFEEDLQDAVGGLAGTAHGKARIENGALLLEGDGSFVESAPLPTALSAKTLEAWVQLANLEQQGGGVIGLQAILEPAFDTIVFGEQNAAHWLASSDSHRRTQQLQGTAEAEANQRPIHLAAVYHADGRIALYREGQMYGKPFQSNGPFRFEAGYARVLFGLRHHPASSERLLKGSIWKAQLYDRALTADELAATAKTLDDYFPLPELVGALDAPGRAEFASLEQQLAELQAQRESLRPTDTSRTGPQQDWQDLAQAIFNLKEFVYLQ